MKKPIIFITFILSLFITTLLFSSSLLKQVEPGSRSYKKKRAKSSLLRQVDPGSKSKETETPQKRIKINKGAKYTIEETARILRSRKIAYFQLDHDDHVYKCIKISNHARDLEGAVDAIVAYRTNFGDTIDDDEVDLIIRISRVDTGVYGSTGRLAKKIGKYETTVKEHFNIVSESEKGNGAHLFNGIERARACSYSMSNDYFSKKRINLLVNIGKIKDEERFFDIYSAMRRVGMDKVITFTTLGILYKMYLVKGDVPKKIKTFLQENNWKSRKQPSLREYYVVRDMMYANEKPYIMDGGLDKPKKKKVKKKKRKKRKYYPKKRKKKKKKKVTKKKSFFSDPCSQILNKK